jgi:uncharacterized protein YggE
MKAFLSTLALLAVAGLASANISVNGTGKVTYVPDIGYIHVGVEGEGKTAPEAWQKNREAMLKIFEALKKLGIAEKDLKTTNVSVTPQYIHPKEKAPILIGYKVHSDLTVTVRKLDDMGKVLDEAVASGANRNVGVSFGCSKLEQLMDEARVKAVKDARKKANLYATGAGAQLGQVVAISDGQDYYRPTRLDFQYAKESGSAPSLPVASGTQDLSVQVSVTYTLLPQALPDQEWCGTKPGK